MEFESDPDSPDSVSDEEKEENSAESSEDISKIEPGNFVIVKYDFEGEERRYVAKIIKIKKKFVVVSCMRPYQGRKNTFIFPQISDEDDVQFFNIVKKLEMPSECRGLFKFNENVNL